MKGKQRTATCGELSSGQKGKTVVLNGWVHRIRNHGGVYFINLRDRYGITQVVVDSDAPGDILALTEGLKREFCVAVEGLVRLRPEGMMNKDMSTGEIEVAAAELTVLNSCPALPFNIDEENDANENLRLQYRYLDLRSPGMTQRIKTRHLAASAVRNFLEGEGFWEIETPTFIKSTPEGARDYLVPSRLQPGCFYALPQSPQIYKQILMAGGTDKYYQIARCYRDEDARGDRQPEFTQIDLEMSFVSREDVLSLGEKLMAGMFQRVLGQDLPLPFPRLTWQEAMDSYGSDKPDLRFELLLQDFAAFAENSDFGVFKKVLEEGGAVKALVVPGAAEAYSRKKITELEETAKSRGARGLAWMKVTDQGLEGGVSKFFAPRSKEIQGGLKASPGDLILLMGADGMTARLALGAVRSRLGKDLKLIQPGTYRFCWVVDFPLFEKEEEGWSPAHHMFSMPQKVEGMEENPGEVLGNLYDMVLNGYEIASGSVRIHDPEIQRRIFKIVGFPEEEAENRFGFLLKALSYGAPPHAGIAFGFDRLVMIMTGTETLREVIAFPKNTTGSSPMDESPSPVGEEQLKELHLKTIPPKKAEAEA